MKEVRFTESVLVRNQDTNEIYRKEIARFATMDDATARTLIAKAQMGDSNAMNKVVEANLKIVWSIAKKYVGLGLSFDDLVQEGNIGLMVAVNTFDASKPYKFTTWILQRVREHINIALTDKSRVVRMNLQQVKNKRNYIMNSMDAAIDSDSEDNGKTFGDTFASDSKADSITTANDLRTQIMLLMSRLSDREKAIVCGLFGIGVAEETEYTLSMRFGISEERVRQIKWEALERMKKMKRFA